MEDGMGAVKIGKRIPEQAKEVAGTSIEDFKGFLEFKGIKRIVSTSSQVGFLEFLQLEPNLGLSLTYLGRAQEMTCILCVTLRDYREVLETILVGVNIISQS